MNSLWSLVTKSALMIWRESELHREFRRQLKLRLRTELDTYQTQIIVFISPILIL
jgi:hypothetical protein